jgi:hypothetical protein
MKTGAALSSPCWKETLMLPDFLVEETIVRDSGESAPFDLGQDARQHIVLTLGITHAVEQQHIQLQIHGSEDGKTWDVRPLLSFPPKCYCGEYKLTLIPGSSRYLKAVWRAVRWGRNEQKPYFRLYLFAEVVRVRAAVSAA